MTLHTAVPPPDVVDVETAAIVMGTTSREVRRLCAIGALPATRIGRIGRDGVCRRATWVIARAYLVRFHETQLAAYEVASRGAVAGRTEVLACHNAEPEHHTNERS